MTIIAVFALSVSLLALLFITFERKLIVYLAQRTRRQLPIIGDVLYGAGISVFAAFVIEFVNGNIGGKLSLMLILALAMIINGVKLRRKGE